MPSGSHPASPSKRRSRSPAPRFEPEQEPAAPVEAPVELAEAAAPAPAEAIVNDVIQESVDEASRREALYKKDAPALVAASLLQDMWASLHLHEAPARPTFGAPSQEPPPQLIDNRTNKQIGIRPKVQIVKAAGSATNAVRSRRRPSSAPARRRPRSARPSSARPGSAKQPEQRPPVPEKRKELFRRASKNEDKMKVSAFARWLDLQNRMSLKEVQAVLGSLKYSRTSPIDVIIFDHVLDYLQAKNKKWADERLVMIDMKPPPRPKKKVEAPAPAPPVEVRTYYEPPAQPRSPLFGRTSEPKEEQPAPAEEEEAPSRPETSYEFTDARPQSAPADGRRRRRKKKKKRRKSKKRAGFFSLKADDEDAKLPHLRPLAKAQQLSLIEDTLFAPEPGVRAVEEGGGAKEGGEFVVPSGLMSRAMYLTLKAGGAPAVPQASPAKSELTPDESPQKNKQTRGTQHLDELLRKLGVEWEERPASAPALRRH